MTINLTFIDALLTVLNEDHDIILTDPTLDANTLTATHDSFNVEINIEVIRNEGTGEAIEVILYSDDLPEVNDLSLGEEHTALFEELHEVDEDFNHYMNNEMDDDEDRGQTL